MHKPLVYKFGGSSLADPEAISRVADIVQSSDRPLAVVVSAMGGITDLLLGGAESAVGGTLDDQAVSAFRERHRQAVAALIQTPQRRRDLEQQVDETSEQFAQLCRSIQTLREHTPRALDAVAAAGERMMACLLCAVLQERGLSAQSIDASTLIKVTTLAGSPFPDLAASTEAVRTHLRPILEGGQVAVIPGFFGAGPDDRLITLGRGGSDLSATVLGHCLDAEQVILFKEVDGLLTADPRFVPEARLVPELHYREAAELAYYGARILHPRTIIPLLEQGIPLIIRNTFNPKAPGTRIAGDVAPGAYPVKALTAMTAQAMIAVEGKGMLGVPGIAARTFSTLARLGTSVAVITQASSEAGICVVVPEAHARPAVAALREAFAREIEQQLVDDVTLITGQAVIAVVGLGMKGTPGIAARTFGALGRHNINVEAIAQGSSELNISIVLDQTDVPAGLLALHREFRLDKLRGLPRQTSGQVQVVILGLGQIGRTLARQMLSQRRYFADKMGLEFRCIALVDTSGVLLAENGLTADELESAVARKEHGGRLLQAGRKLTLSELADELNRRLWPLALHQSILVDATAEDTADIILQALQAGSHVALANKKPLAVRQDDFDVLFRCAQTGGVLLRYEATVGAGLPILDTLAKLDEAGDEVLSIRGCFSGTLGYLMTEVSGGRPFSQAVRQAGDLGYTEPDPREDLCGMDVARKALILARTLGRRLNLEDIRVQSLVPAALSEGDPAAFLDTLRNIDSEWSRRVAEARQHGRTWRYVACIDGEGIAVGLEAVDLNSPLGQLQGTDNQVIIRTRRYDANPLILTGPGAGAEVTAAGVLNDVLAIAGAQERPRSD